MGRTNSQLIGWTGKPCCICNRQSWFSSCCYKIVWNHGFWQVLCLWIRQTTFWLKQRLASDPSKYMDERLLIVDFVGTTQRMKMMKVISNRNPPKESCIEEIRQGQKWFFGLTTTYLSLWYSIIWPDKTLKRMNTKPISVTLLWKMGFVPGTIELYKGGILIASGIIPAL